MSKKMSWGLAALIILICVVGAIVIFSIETDTEEKKAYKPAEEQVSPVTDNQPPRPAKAGHKWENHGDHWHEVEITKPTEPRFAEVDKPVEAPKPVVQTYEGPLTYHKELLETNPVEALRQQSIERGHPAAKWIPPFLPDDLEAQEFARNIYLSIYLDEDDPAYNNAAIAVSNQADAINGYPYGARRSDLLRLIWIKTTIPVDVYSPEKIPYPSDYFSQ